MPAQSRKGKVQIVNKDGESITLDAKHDEVLARISREEEKIPAMKRDIDDKKILLREWRRQGAGGNGRERPRGSTTSADDACVATSPSVKSNAASVSLSDYMDLAEEIQAMRRRVRAIEKKRKDYYLQNSQYIFKYFEQKQSIATETTAPNKNYSLNNFFKISEARGDAFDSAKSAEERDREKDSSNRDMQRYMLNINEMNPELYQSVLAKDVCSHCNKGEMVMYDSDGILICTNCSRITKYIIEHEKPSYKDPPKEVCFYAYKRINHFREILAQFQAKESTQIPEKVLEDFKMQIKKERIGIDQLTNKKAKEILKKLNHSKYYEHVPFIKDKMGIKPPVMDNTLEETLCNLFLEIQAPYAKYCPDSRVNFLNYYYTIYKLCELLDRREFLEYFPMLKDKSKRIEQDNIWKNICKELNWRFIATV
jgi:hypothetical protein